MNWEDVSVGEFRDSIAKTDGVCLFPIGCLEKHGDHLPLGTDIAIARQIAQRTAVIEECMIFPYYPFGIVSEVRHTLGTVALDARLQLEIIEQTCAEIARNGYKKIIIGNGHGGNNFALHYLAQAMLDKRRDYVVHVVDLWVLTKEQYDWLAAKYGAVGEYGHADIYETSDMMAVDENLVHMERVKVEESRSLHRMDALNRLGIYTGFNWYGDYPNQFAGDPVGAGAEYGNDILNFNVANLVEVIREIKRTDLTAQLAKEFYDRADAPAL